jgi:hypothetical protein
MIETTNIIKPSSFCWHYKNPDKIYQIMGIARTDDLNSSVDYNKKPHFFAKDTEIDEFYYGFILPNSEIIISWNRHELIINEKYVLYWALDGGNRYYREDNIWARKLTNFMADVDTESGRIKRFNFI